MYGNKPKNQFQLGWTVKPKVTIGCSGKRLVFDNNKRHVISVVPMNSSMVTHQVQNNLWAITNGDCRSAKRSLCFRFVIMTSKILRNFLYWLFNQPRISAHAHCSVAINRLGVIFGARWLREFGRVEQFRFRFPEGQLQIKILTMVHISLIRNQHKKMCCINVAPPNITSIWTWTMIKSELSTVESIHWAPIHSTKSWGTVPPVGYAYAYMSLCIWYTCLSYRPSTIIC
jgi:hypothetical protein